MKAWILDRAAGRFTFDNVPEPGAAAGSIVVAMKAVPLLSYTGEYLAGKRAYQLPSRPFSPGTNGVGVIHSVGRGVHHLRVGQRVALSPYFVQPENVDEPAQILIGLTGLGPESAATLEDWPDGTLREFAQFPATAAVPLDGLDGVPFVQLAVLGKFAIPMGGLVRSRLAAGEVLLVNGATGYFGSAAVMLGLALGASRVIAAGRDGAVLGTLAERAGPRVRPVVLTGDIERDGRALRDASDGAGAHVAFDMVGQAASPNSTLAALHTLRRGGRLVLMGSMTVPLPLPYADVLRHGWEICGQFMYAPADYRRLVALVRTGQLDLGCVETKAFALADLLPAVESAADMRALECTVVTLWPATTNGRL